MQGPSRRGEGFIPETERAATMTTVPISLRTQQRVSASFRENGAAASNCAWLTLRPQTF